MKHFIFPYDLTASTNHSLEYAIGLTKKMDAELTVVHVHQPEVVATGMSIGAPYYETLPVPKSVYEHMDNLRVTLGKVQGLKYDIHISVGNLTEELISVAEKKKAELIIMATSGAKTLTKQIFGTNTSNLIKKHKIPVLVLPHDYKETVTEKPQFVFSTDFKTINDWDILELFKDFALAYNATINIFHVSEPYFDKTVKDLQKDEIEGYKDFFKGIDIEVHTSYKSDLKQAVLQFVKQKHASMLLMVSHDRDFIDSMLHKSATVEMTLHTRIPLLAIPDVHLEINASISGSGIGYF